jgi:hypothetical protein
MAVSVAKREQREKLKEMMATERARRRALRAPGAFEQLAAVINAGLRSAPHQLMSLREVAPGTPYRVNACPWITGVVLSQSPSSVHVLEGRKESRLAPSTEVETLEKIAATTVGAPASNGEPAKVTVRREPAAVDRFGFRHGTRGGTVNAVLNGDWQTTEQVATLCGLPECEARGHMLLMVRKGLMEAHATQKRTFRLKPA